GRGCACGKQCRLAHWSQARRTRVCLATDLNPGARDDWQARSTEFLGECVLELPAAVWCWLRVVPLVMVMRNEVRKGPVEHALAEEDEAVETLGLDGM